MRLLFFDTETTGDKPDESCIVEFAACFYDTVTKRSYGARSCLIKTLRTYEDELPFSELHGVTKNVLLAHGEEPVLVASAMKDLFSACDFAVAHNGLEFDRPMIEGWSKRAGVPVTIPRIIDSRTDLPPEMYTTRCRAQAHMLAERGIANPFPHQAMADVMALIRLCSFTDMEKAAEISLSPRVKIIARTDFSQKDLPKAAGFSWDPVRKVWSKMTRECFLESDLAKCNFEYVVRRQEDLDEAQRNP